MTQFWGIWWKGDSVEAAQFCETYAQADGSTVCYEAYTTRAAAEACCAVCNNNCDRYEVRALPAGLTVYAVGAPDGVPPVVSTEHADKQPASDPDSITFMVYAFVGRDAPCQDGRGFMVEDGFNVPLRQARKIWRRIAKQYGNRDDIEVRVSRGFTLAGRTNERVISLHIQRARSPIFAATNLNACIGSTRALLTSNGGHPMYRPGFVRQAREALAQARRTRECMASGFGFKALSR